MRMIKVAITGYNGFIAQHLDKKLREYEYSPIGVPRKTLTNLFELTQFFDINRPSYIIHTAAYGNKFSQENDLDTVTANIFCLFNLLEATRLIPYTGFINFSTSSVMLPYQTMYSATKACGELLVNAFVTKYKKPICTVRPFTIIGKGEPDEHLIPTLIQAALMEKEIPFVPEPVHDMLDVRDFSSAILSIMEHIEQLQGLSIDIGSGVQRTNQEVLKEVEKATGKNIKTVITKNLRPYDTTTWKADTRILTAMGWKPTYSLNDTIHSMYEKP